MKTTLLTMHLCMAFFCSTAWAQNVGIGTTTPTRSRLDIFSASNQSALTISTGVNTTGISLSAPGGNQATLSFNLNYGNGFHFLANGYGGNFTFSHNSGILSYTTTQTKGNPGDFAFFNSTNLYIDSNGYVGLGTSVPKARFHALNAVIGSSAVTPATGYILSVGGKIICEEVKVQLTGSWPDYVFEKDYPLAPLEQVEQEVLNTKHLPGIPSAHEINSMQGVEMGELQKKMLEKMEELYRYVFEVNRENKVLKEKLAILETKLNGNNHN